MIRRGKAEGWLRLPVDAVKPWAEASGVKFTAAEPTFISGRGLCLVATRDLSYNASIETEILSVAEDLVLSSETISKHAKSDQDLQEVLESLGEFGRTPRGSILTFLLFQASMSCPNLSSQIGVHCAFTEYVKSLPSELLPTFWSEEELALLVGTTLAPAISAKHKSLRREYDILCELVANTRWFRLVQPHLELDDWLQVDAMFRSRALEFYGSCMVPGLDIASHASGDATNSYYERKDGACLLCVLKNQEVKEGEEITITYGDEKGACEMVFSYGFLEDQMNTAETLFLSLEIPDSDVARAAKMAVADCAPGFKIIDIQNTTNDTPADASGDEQRQQSPKPDDIDWTGDYIWLLCVTAEDGLQFKVASTINGEEELRASFNGQELQHGAAGLRRLMAQHKLWDVYRLRAIVILQQRVLDQLQILYETQDQVEAMEHGGTSRIREQTFLLATKLRQLEFELLDKAYNAFEAEKMQLANSVVVQQYLAEMNAENEKPHE